MAMTIMSFSCCSPSTFNHKTSINFPPSSSSALSSSSLKFNTFSSSSTSTSRIVPKLSETETPATIESESAVSAADGDGDIDIVAAQQTLNQDSKGEQVFAIVMIGGRQYIVFPGRFLYTQRLKGANVNDKIILNKVLLVGTKTSTYIGYPVVPNAAVHAVVEEQGLDPKVVVFKYKKKKNYRRNIGHRQPNTRIRILGITGYQDSPAVTLP
ncbi:large ribosomal subunit protein bL21c-like [Rutidosis leptorrhynchoides]|uniref:large ribosomal subunit protein bL21c-like n=1 Tax=Rutidosis leptorrhynchoides TaxID=125765 RepID=UPI003A995019